MPEPIESPVQQSDDPVQQPPAPATTPPAPKETPPSPPKGYVEQERFNGAIRKIEELTTTNRTLTSDIAAKTSELEQLRAQLATKDVEKTVAVSERDRALETSLTDAGSLRKELAALQAYQMKVEMAKELGQPELISILHTIPDMQDKETLKVVMQDFIRFRDDGIKAREKQLLAGVTPPIAQMSSTPELPTTNEGWERYVNTFQLGSTERARAFDAWGDWQLKRG